MAETSAGHNVLDYEWHCPSCTFINKPGSFKCHMCKTPKGTATRQVKSSASALEMQYATETAIKAHNSRLKAAAAAAAANQLLISSVSTAMTTVALSTSFTTASTSSCTTVSSADTPFNPSNGNSGLVGQKRRQRSRNQNFYSSTTSPVHSSSKVMQKMSKTTRVNRRVKRSCDITVNGMTVTITEIETISD